MRTVFWFVGILVVVLLLIGELWLLNHIGIDILTHLQLTFEQGTIAEVVFESVCVVVLIVIHQPRVFGWLLRGLSGDVGRYISEFLRSSIRP